MQKVIYCVTKKSGYDFIKTTGFGYITDKDLITACISKNGKPYVRVFEDCLKDIHKDVSREDEYKGDIYEMYEIDGKDIQVEYSIWYKIQK